MNNLNYVHERRFRNDLALVVEPLASYICATEQPKTGLMSAWAVLLREVEGTNQAAVAHFRAFLQNGR